MIMYQRIQRALDYVLERAELGGLRWAFCAKADREHEESERQYMHTYCKRDAICVARAATELNREQLIALIAHEVAHVLMGDRPGEYEADRIGSKIVGRIRYSRDAVQTIGSGVDRTTALRRYKLSS